MGGAGWGKEVFVGRRLPSALVLGDNCVTAAAFGCGVSSVFLPPPHSSDLTQADRWSRGCGHHSKSCS